MHNIAFYIRPLLITAAVSLIGQQVLKGQSATKVSAELESEKSVFQTGEPITLFARLRNPGIAPVDVFSSLDTGYGTITVEVGNTEEGPFAEYRGPGWGRDETEPSTITLKSGDTVENEIVMLTDPGSGGSLLDTLPRFPFSQGQYWVRVRVHDPDMKTSVISQAIQIRVEDPKDPDTAEFARKVAANPDLADFLQTGDMGIDQETVELATDHLAKEHRSPIALAAAAAVGRHYGQKDPEKALQWLRVVVDNADPASAVRNRAQLQVVRILAEHGAAGEMSATLESASAEPKRVAFRRQWTILKDEIER